MGVFADVELDELVLTTPRLTLRPWRRDDAEAVAEIMRGADLGEFLALPDPYTLDDAIGFVTAIGGETRSAGTGLECAVVETVSGQLVASAALRLPRPRRLEAEVGYWVGRAYQGQGYAAEVTRALTDWAFAHGVSRVELFCAVRNLASAKTALNAGFRFEAVLHGHHPMRDGDPADSALFARLPSDSGAPTPRAAVDLPGGGLSDGIVLLRVMAPGDEAGLGEQEADPVTRSWEFTAEPRTALEHRRLCAGAALQWLTGQVMRCAIVDVETGRYAGMISIRPAGPPQIGGIGYAVHPAFRGRGYTARALRLLTAWAFGEADFARLELGAKVGNIASQKAALAAGFERDGVRATRMRNPDGTFTDEARFAALNPRHVQRDAG
ncbi:MAG TPA: GNAT family N-acetyltransferase [Jatrophihabitans sp.]|jgi:RimJ/RimL family protein N-acetyltransferase|uniref:GNAT family N-acetyltransferase n=1 Tax=Jatrophihabitans sp. TaxID=1932789 RepID=UPI002E0C9C80|nr:GNAT family N-acetyltransferase [Jatrophihabitans sp.]